MIPRQTNRIPDHPEILKPAVLAYQHALTQWKAFHANTSAPGLGECLWQCETSPPDEIAGLLRLLPTGERTPVAFGVFFKGARHWRPIEQTVYLGEFLSGPTPGERKLLEAAVRGVLPCPEKLPVTLEEFPSRIWQRAQAKQAPARLVAAACLAVAAIVRLLDGYVDEPVNDTPDFSKLQPGESMDFHVPSGDLPAVLDLVALTPSSLKELKLRVLAKVEADILAENLPFLKEMFPAMSAWILMEGNADGESMLEGIVREARLGAEHYLRDPSLYHHHHTRRLGRLMIRFGQRCLANRCAKAIGHSPWQQGWQHQALANAPHTSIRNAIMQTSTDTDAWLHDPALASSAMSRPLWLNNTVSRLPELIALFTRAADCPWIFPRLHDIFQWHLALADKRAELRAVEALAPDWAVGLANQSPSPRHQST